MTQEEIKEYNKRCAEFLGWIKTHPKIKDWHIYITPIGHVSYDKMLFHSDWNWIMEVLSKIEESHHTVISQGITGHYVNINREDVNILTQTLDNPSKFMGVGKTKKEVVIKSINQFLIWYNENNK